jgi:hypothetical protein
MPPNVLNTTVTHAVIRIDPQHGLMAFLAYEGRGPLRTQKGPVLETPALSDSGHAEAFAVAGMSVAANEALPGD